MPLQQVTTTETRVHYKRYLHHAHAVGTSWAILTCCFLIVNIIVFVEPQWIGDTDKSPGTGWVGLFQTCELVNSGSVELCEGAFQDFSTIITPAFKAATWFVGVSVLVIFLCILLFLLFLFIEELYVYIVCGSLQVISTIFMFLGCVIFPRGWDHILVQRICGDSYPYHRAQCGFRWAYILAIIGTFFILLLAILAFVLAFRQAEKWTKYEQTAQDNKSKSGAGYVVDVAPSKAGSVIMPHGTLSAPGGTRAGSTLGHHSRMSVYPPAQPTYVVDDHLRDPSELSTTRKRLQSSSGSNAVLYHDGYGNGAFDGM